MNTKITKASVIESLKTISLTGNGENIISKGLVSNVMIFGDQVDIDLELQNPVFKLEKNLRLLY